MFLLKRPVTGLIFPGNDTVSYSAISITPVSGNVDLLFLSAGTTSAPQPRNGEIISDLDQRFYEIRYGYMMSVIDANVR